MNKKHIMVAGAGKIGRLVHRLLSSCGDYVVYLVDAQCSEDPDVVFLDVRDADAMTQYIQKNKIIAVISCLPYFLNSEVAKIAHNICIHYFDTTEDVNVTEKVKILARTGSSAMVPQCGLAPGFIGIAANHLIHELDEYSSALLRVGALPQRTSSGLHYSLTWSTDGLINEYGNPCVGIEAQKKVILQPLDGLETLCLDGCTYEAFNTSGGLGSLADDYQGKITTLNYKTLRYPGHCEKMRFLMNDLGLNQDRETLKRILEHAIPKTYQDVVVIYISVSGMKNGQFIEKSYYKKLYPMLLEGKEWTAIQATTASAVCAVVDLVLADTQRYQGLVLQEHFKLNEILSNRFGKHYA